MKRHLALWCVLIGATVLGVGPDARACGVRFQRPWGPVLPVDRTHVPRGQHPVDDATWEVWWEMNRIDLLARYDPARPSRARDAAALSAGLPALDAAAIERRLWPHLLAAAKAEHPFTVECAFAALSRVATTEARRASVRELLLEKLGHRNHLIARCASLCLAQVADPAAMDAMSDRALEESTEEDVRAFLALSLQARGDPRASRLLRKLADEAGHSSRGGELAAAALVGLGAVRGPDRARAASYLELVAFGKEGVSNRHRALAVESLGRLANATLGPAPLVRALDDAHADVRRASVVGLGRLDLRTGPGVARAVAIEEARIENRLVHALNGDPDPLVRRLAAIGLGTIAGRGRPCVAGMSALGRQVASDRAGMREFALLGLAIGGEPSGIDRALVLLPSPNPSTRSAACIALGIACAGGRDLPGTGAATRARAGRAIQRVLGGDGNPHVRAYAALALGLIGRSGAAASIRAALGRARTSEERAYGLLGLALTGEATGPAAILDFMRGDLMRDGKVACHAIYALGLTKDRQESTFVDLMAKARDGSRRYVQAAALLALGYLATPERYGRRHRMAAGTSYWLHFELPELYVCML